MKENDIKMKEEKKKTKKEKQLRFNDDFKACKIKERSFKRRRKGKQKSAYLIRSIRRKISE